jgi:hypothetical protein
VRHEKKLAAQREILDEWIQKDPDRPVYSAIRKCFVEKFARFYIFVMEPAHKAPSKLRSSVGQTVQKARSELKQLDRECMTLAGLLFSHSNLWAARDWRQPSIIKFLLRSIRRGRGGRPLTRLGIAVQVKELRLADGKCWKWPVLTDKFCDCGSAEHGIRCQDNLRREVLHLERFLRRCGCAIAESGKTR